MATKLRFINCWSLTGLLYAISSLVVIVDSEQLPLPGEQSTSVFAVSSASFLLPCHAAEVANPHNNVSWLRLDDDHNDGSRMQFDSRHRQLSNGSLYFQQVVGGAGSHGKTDAGRYQCAVHTDVGTILSAPVTLHIASLPHFASTSADLQLSVGDTARFECVVHGIPPPKIVWRKGRHPLDLTNRRYTVLPSGVLQINSVRLLDSGSYRCRAQNVAKTRHSAAMSLQVERPSTTGSSTAALALLAGPKNQTKVVHDTVILECAVKATQQRVVFKWLKHGGGDVVLDDRVSIVGEGNLMIRDVQTFDENLYTCTVHSDIGEVLTASAYLTVREAPYVQYASENAVRFAASIVRFRCDFGGTPRPDRVTWLKNGKRVQATGRIQVYQDGRLVISQCTEADSGFYQCVGGNVVGQALATMRLYVRSAPNAASRPINLVAKTLSSTSIELSWTQPPSETNHSTIAFTVHYYIPSGENPELQMVLADTSCKVVNLQPHTNYTFYVVHYNHNGASPHSDSVTQVTDEDVPIRVPKLYVKSHGSHSLLIEWDELSPRDARGVITQYRLLYRRHGQAAQHSKNLLATGDRCYIIDGLRSDHEYDVYLIAGTAVGFAQISEEKWEWVTQRTGMGPTAVTCLHPPILTLRAINGTSVLVTWQQATGGATVQGYRLTYRQLIDDAQPDQGETTIFLKNVNRYIITKLMAHTWYEMHLNAYNDDTEGEATRMTVQTKKMDEPPITLLGSPPNGLEAYPVSENAIRLVWKRPIDGADITSYLIRYCRVPMLNATTYTKLTSSEEEILVKGLQPHTMYEFVVQSSTPNMTGAFSNPIQCRTLPGYPSAPENPRWSLSGPGTVSLRWHPPRQANGVIVTYTAFYSTDQYAPVESWAKQVQKGEASEMVVDKLKVDQQYYFKLQAATSKGSGPTTRLMVVKTQAYRQKNNSTVSAARQQDIDPQLGIFIGVAVCVCSIIICIVIILLRNRCCQRPSGPVIVADDSMKANGHVPSGGHADVDSYLPMLDMSKGDDSNIYNEYVQRKTTPNGFVCDNGRNGSKKNVAPTAAKIPLLPRGGTPVENGGPKLAHGASRSNGHVSSGGVQQETWQRPASPIRTSHQYDRIPALPPEGYTVASV